MISGNLTSSRKTCCSSGFNFNSFEIFRFSFDDLARREFVLATVYCKYGPEFPCKDNDSPILKTISWPIPTFKNAYLKVGIGQDIVFNIGESLSLRELWAIFAI